MSCGKEFNTGNCVCDILKEIADAQSDIIENGCVNCEQSIADLLGDNTLPIANELDTVPVLLYTKEGEPFKGFGADYGAISDIQGSFFFRVKEVDEDCCATLELLRDPNDPDDNPECPVDQYTGNLETTGICITVNANCFCHITCLPAIDAL
ncbi:spore coat protein [Radiobacillus kanasensis]|uniref:CotY/CotZ family spore coat protein n=1 Tax=Radiobacillus kanasensis TaxID=2844358 RepID=UPI001E47B5EE|nr:CotY/CotZ family spore coat protein [Radiobacillus kanasensis]UFU01342.1 spore coat protein [Radiobacillus kanasensis]